MFGRLTTFFRLMVSGAAILSLSASANHVEYQPDQWWAILRAQAEYVRGIADLRMAWAESELRFAQARVTDERTIALREYNHQLKVDLDNLRKETHKNKDLMKHFLSKVAIISHIKSGRTSNRTVGAMNYFLDNVTTFGEVKGAYKIEVPPEAKGKENFRYEGALRDVEIKPFEGKTVSQLLKFMTDNNYSASGPFADVVLVLNEACESLMTGVQKRLEGIKEKMKAAREETFDIWHAPWISVLPNEFSGIRGYFPGGRPEPGILQP